MVVASCIDPAESGTAADIAKTSLERATVRAGVVLPWRDVVEAGETSK
jgi:hypothetical protein